MGNGEQWPAIYAAQPSESPNPAALRCLRPVPHLPGLAARGGRSQRASPQPASLRPVHQPKPRPRLCPAPQRRRSRPRLRANFGFVTDATPCVISVSQAVLRPHESHEPGGRHHGANFTLLHLGRCIRRRLTADQWVSTSPSKYSPHRFLTTLESTKKTLNYPPWR